MSESPMQEPVRWLDDPQAGAALRADLGHGASAAAAGVDYAAGLVGLRSAIAAQTGALAPAAVGGSSIGFKIFVGSVVVGAIAAIIAVGQMGPSGADDTRVRAPIAAKPSVAAPSPIEPAPVKAPVVAPVPEEPIAIEPAAVDAEPAPVADVEPAVARDKPRKPKVAESDDDRFLREAQLVAQARKQLGTDARQALASTRKHEKEFPKGALVEERRAIEVRALAKLGRMDDARREAASFLGEFGDGPHAAAVRRAIAGDDAP